MTGGGEWAFRFASDVCNDPMRAVSRWKALSGSKAAGCVPLYAPVEILHAAGMLPVTLWGNELPLSASVGAPSFLCSVARGIVSAIHSEGWREIDAWVFPSTCDTLQNAFEVLSFRDFERPRFPLVFPASAEAPGSTEYLLDRLEAFLEWAGRVSGRLPTEGALDRSVRIYDENRRLFSLLEDRLADVPGIFTAGEFHRLARAGMVIPPESHSEILRAALSRRTHPDRLPRAKVFVSGMMATDAAAEALDAAGAALVGNDLALGHRSYSCPPCESGDVLLGLARRHLRREPCSTLHGADGGRIEALFRRVASSGADRLILLRMRQCEPETGDIADIAADARKRGIPFLCLDLDLHADERASLRVRIDAFVEMGERAE